MSSRDEPAEEATLGDSPTAELRLEPVHFIARVDAVLRLGSLMLSAGASSARVRDTMRRVAAPLGIDRLDARVGMTDIVVTAERRGMYRTRVAEVRPGVDATRITELKRLSYRLGSHVTVDELNTDLDRIENAGPLHPRWLRTLGAGAACAAFALLLNGDWPEAIAAFAAAGAGQTIRMSLLRVGVNEFLVAFIAGVVSLSLFLGGAMLLDLAGAPPGRHEAALTAAVLFLVPGFPLVTGALDLARLDLNTGMSRVVYGALMLLATGSAVWAVAAIVSSSTAEVAAPLLSEPVLTLVRVGAGFVGVLGFAILFSTPWRIAMIAAVIGGVANAGRLLLTDIGTTPAVAALAAALAVGVGAYLVSGRLRAARITLTVPAVLIMVPGAATYRAISAMIDGDTLAAVEQAAEAMFVLAALAIGLTVARIVTEREWIRPEP